MIPSNSIKIFLFLFVCLVDFSNALFMEDSSHVRIRVSQVNFVNYSSAFYGELLKDISCQVPHYDLFELQFGLVFSHNGSMNNDEFAIFALATRRESGEFRIEHVMNQWVEDVRVYNTTWTGDNPIVALEMNVWAMYKRITFGCRAIRRQQDDVLFSTHKVEYFRERTTTSVDAYAWSTLSSFTKDSSGYDIIVECPRVFTNKIKIQRKSSKPFISTAISVMWIDYAVVELKDEKRFNGFFPQPYSPDKSDVLYKGAGNDFTYSTSYQPDGRVRVTITEDYRIVETGSRIYRYSCIGPYSTEELNIIEIPIIDPQPEVYLVGDASSLWDDETMVLSCHLPQGKPREMYKLSIIGFIKNNTDLAEFDGQSNPNIHVSSLVQRINQANNIVKITIKNDIVTSSREFRLRFVCEAKSGAYTSNPTYIMVFSHKKRPKELQEMDSIYPSISGRAVMTLVNENEFHCALDGHGTFDVTLEARKSEDNKFVTLGTKLCGTNNDNHCLKNMTMWTLHTSFRCRLTSSAGNVYRLSNTLIPRSIPIQPGQSTTPSHASEHPCSFVVLFIMFFFVVLFH